MYGKTNIGYGGYGKPGGGYRPPVYGTHKPAGGPPGLNDPRGGMSESSKIGMAMVAQAAVSSWHSYKMDKINRRMRQNTVDFKKEQRAQGRRHGAAMHAMNQEKLQEALWSEKLALDIQQMQDEAKARNALSLNFNAQPSVVRDIQRENLRQDLYQLRDHENKAEVMDVQEVDSYRSQEILYDTQKVSGWDQTVNFGVQALSIGHATYGRFTKGG